MSEPKHTPGKLHATFATYSDKEGPRCTGIWSKRNYGDCEIVTTDAGVYGPEPEDARRLVAAWNEVESISTEALEQGALTRLLQGLRGAFACLDALGDKAGLVPEGRAALLAVRVALAELEGK